MRRAIGSVFCVYNNRKRGHFVATVVANLVENFDNIGFWFLCGNLVGYAQTKKRDM